MWFEEGARQGVRGGHQDHPPRVGLREGALRVVGGLGILDLLPGCEHRAVVGQFVGVGDRVRIEHDVGSVLGEMKPHLILEQAADLVLEGLVGLDTTMSIQHIAPHASAPFAQEGV